MCQTDTQACPGCGEHHPSGTPCPDGTRWCTATVRCRICAHEHVSVWPTTIVDETMQECPACGHMACEPVEDVIEGPDDFSGGESCC